MSAIKNYYDNIYIFLFHTVLISSFLFIHFSLFSESPQQIKPWMGVSIEEKDSGITVRDTIPGTPAEKAGFLKGDRIKSVDGIPMREPKQLIGYIQSKGVGNEVIVEMERNQKNQSITLKLEPRPDDLDLVRKQSIGKQIPKFELQRMNSNETFTHKQIENKVTVIEFWATWCPACVGSHKRLSSFAEENTSIQVIAVSGEEFETIQRYNNLILPKFTILRDGKNEMGKFFSITAIPMTVVVDSSGTIQFVTLGSGSYLEEALKFALNLEKSKKK